MGNSKKKQAKNEKYHNNPYEEREKVKKYMTTRFNEPTKDTFSNLDTTDDSSYDSSYDARSTPVEPRPSSEGKINFISFLKDKWVEILIIPVISGAIVMLYNFNARISVNENNHENQEEKINRNIDGIDKIESLNNTIKSDIRIMDYRLKSLEENKSSK